MQAGLDRLKWWQIALISVGVSILGGLSGMVSSKRQKKLYTKVLKQAPWSPPSWVFAPAWTFNNLFLLKALQRILSKEMPEKRRLLMLQAGIWFVFFTFNYVYFKKKSPVLAAIWTIGDNVLAVASLLISLKSDRKLAFNFIPLVLWTSFAGAVADYQALKNADPLLKTPALLQ